MGISKKTRFEVFKRDGFLCAYCGSTPPNVVLEVDHIHPVSEGGGDEMENLITACFDCNRGKTNILLNHLPAQLSENIEELREREEQLREFYALKASIQERIEMEVDCIFNLLRTGVDRGMWFMGEKERLSIKNFLKKLPFFEIKEAAEIAISRKNTEWNAFKYFCGICWQKIKRGPHA